MWSNPGFIADFLRGFFSILDSIGYFFLSGIFDIFFVIASANIFQGDIINTFYTRIQMILGIFMIFRISITLLQMIVNPDTFKDKQKGAGSLVKRIAVMLVLLSLIVPIEGIPASDDNPLNQQIKTNGILFGFLYQLQNSVVEDNILGKLILGSDVDNISSDNSANGLELNEMSSVGDVITAQIATSFIRPTLLSSVNEDDIITQRDYEGALACDEASAYFANPTSSSLLTHVNDTCESADGEEVYAFEYTGFGGVVCAIVMTIIIIGFTLDVAVRAIKLAVLRLIAPVPIISYISPGQEKNGAFGNWVKTLTSTYLSLFIRLIIIYFGIYLIIILREGNLISWTSTTSFITNTLANIFIIIGILVFMKEAPKFFQDMLGIKGDGKLFSGIGTMLGAAALTGGVAGSVVTGIKAGWQEGQDFRDNAEANYGKFGRYGSGALSVLRATASGVAGGIGGAFVGGRTLATTDKKVPGSVYSAMQRSMTRRAAHSTVFGRGWDKFSSAVTGSSPVDRMDAQIEGYNTASSLVDSIFAKADADGDWKYNYTYVDDDGVTHTGSASVKQLKKEYELLQNSDGVDFKTLSAARERYENAQEALIGAAITGKYTKGPFAEQIQIDYKNLRDIDRSRALKLFGKVDENIEKGDTVAAVKSFKAVKFTAADKARNTKNTTKYSSRKANQQYSKQ